MLRTRGGIHLLVDPAKVNTIYKNKFYQGLRSLAGADKQGDLMIPVPGCVQGTFMPHFIYKPFD